jgi:hypothetical protein
LALLHPSQKFRKVFLVGQLAELIGLSPLTLARIHERDRNGFQFVRAGMNGSEIAWEMKKLKAKR